jgi:hypothetical protein
MPHSSHAASLGGPLESAEPSATQPEGDGNSIKVHGRRVTAFAKTGLTRTAGVSIHLRIKSRDTLGGPVRIELTRRLCQGN